jgi:hypothetical protein
MPWVRIDDGFDDDPDIDNMSPAAIALFFCSITWSSRNLTDGFVPERRASKLPGYGEAEVAELCAGEKPWWRRVEGGFQVRSYLNFNPSREEVEKKRAETAERVKSHRNGKRNRGSTRGETASVTPAVTTDVTHSETVEVTNGVTALQTAVETGESGQQANSHSGPAEHVSTTQVQNGDVTALPTPVPTALVPRASHIPYPPNSETNVSGDPPPGGSPPPPSDDPPPLVDDGTQPSAKPPAEPFASVERVLVGVAEALDTPSPTREEVTRWIAPSSTLRRLIGKYGVEGTVKLYVFAAKNTTRGGLDWNSIWNQNAALWAQMRDGVPQRGGGGKESLQDQQRRIAEALRP